MLATNEKYYVVDLGLKNITQTNKYDADLGHKLENIVYLELLRRGGKVFVGKNKNKEVDFIVQKASNEREYYQVTYTVNDEKTFEREVSSLRNIRDNYPKYLLTLDYDNAIIEGIQKKNVIDCYWKNKEKLGRTAGSNPKSPYIRIASPSGEKDVTA